MKRFDRKFGADFITNLPHAPAVYVFRDEEARVIYVGKAKDVKKRLRSYRNASRRKVHRKMREIVSAASTLEVRLQGSEQDALAVENELIRTLEPEFNVAGKYSFLYPAIGLKRTDARSLLCFATDVDSWSELGFRWFGTFPSRPRAKEAFDALVELLGLVGHLERTSSLRMMDGGPMPDVMGSRVVGLRQLGEPLLVATELFLSGDSADALRVLALMLLEKPRARREATRVQGLIHLLKDFYEVDAEPLRRALGESGIGGTFVPQDERDVLFIRFGG